MSYIVKAGLLQRSTLVERCDAIDMRGYCAAPYIRRDTRTQTTFGSAYARRICDVCSVSR
eukprot:6195872-Pleurochrysis_carterae.AAC.1